MTPLRRFIILAAFVFAYAGVGAAQKERYCEVPPPSPFKHNALIATRYDSAAKRMKTTLRHPRLLGKPDNGLYLYASFFHQDPRLQTRPSVDVLFISISRELKYRNSHELTILTDGQRWPAAAPLQYSSGTNGEGLKVETTKVTLPFESLARLIRARRVSARLGPTEFELTHNHLEALRELAMLMGPQKNSNTTAPQLQTRARTVGAASRN